MMNRKTRAAQFPVRPDWNTAQGRADLAVSNWRFSLDNPQGCSAPIPEAEALIHKMCAEQGLPLEFACKNADWFEECWNSCAM